MSTYYTPLLSYGRQRLFCKLPVGSQVFVNVYKIGEIYDIGSGFIHETREDADKFSRTHPRPIYRFRIVKTKKCKKNEK